MRSHARRVRRVIILDDAAGVAAGKALDIQQAGAIDGSHARLEGGADLSRGIGAAVCIIADRSGRSSSEWQGDEALALMTRLVPYSANPRSCSPGHLRRLLAAAARELHIPRERLIGSAAEALSGAVKSMVAIEANAHRRKSDSPCLVHLLAASWSPGARRPLAAMRWSAS